ncbi:probable transcription factor At1g61730 [Ipomoea triloba]|uniref:probable transcription factor At1g61730 n=1 Tax=Ipomoea triloba TaxID=35885 RepID=UPI00125D9B6C|nr:probable transcription factor At1g61730 [Ipomoea triloba]
MAKNRSEPKKSVAEEEEEEDSSTDNEGSESDSSESEPEPEQTQTEMQIAKRPSAAATKVTEASSTPAKIQAASSASYETDSESDFESESQRPAPIVKPNDHPRESGQSKPRKSGAEAKRPAPAADREVTESKRQKRNPEFVVEISEIKPSADDSKKQLFQRLWSEDDEIALLEGMIEYTEKENADPHTDLDAFHDFIRNSLHFTVSKNQLQNKIKRMRKKYINNAGKGKSFSKPNEQKTYQLSRKIWGKGDEKIEDSSQVGVVHVLMACSNGSAKEEKINKKSMKKAPVVQDAIETPEANAAAASSGSKNVKRMEADNNANGSNRFNSLSRFMVKNKGIVIGEEKRNEIEKKRKAVVVAEIDLFLKELELIQEQVKATLDAMK